MPMVPYPTSRETRDYARYGRSRTGAPPLPSSPAEVGAYAQRAYRARLGPILSASLLPTLILVLVERYTFTVLYPSLTSTNAPTSNVVQAQEFEVQLLIGLAVAGPLVLLAVAGYLIAAYTQFGQWSGLIPAAHAVEERRRFGRAVVILARLFGRELIVPLIGAAVMVLGGVSERVLGEDSYIGGVLLLAGGGIAIISLLITLNRFARLFEGVPAALYESLTPREAVQRIRERFKRPKKGSSGSRVPITATSQEGTIFALAFLMLIFILGLRSALDAFGLQEGLAGAVRDPVTTLVISETISSLPIFLAALFLAPYFALLIVTAYFERRVRTEGLDIELMAAALERGR
ncbi:MAG: hypothetical protein C4320_09660 [Armatimonadota bacterium]